MKLGKKVLSILLTVLITISLLPPLTPLSMTTYVEASSDDANALSSLGIDTNALPPGYDASENVGNPYGRSMVAVAPVYELYVATPSWGKLYGHDQALDVTVGQFYNNDVIQVAPLAGYDAYHAVAGDFTGDGLQGQLATVAVKVNSEGTFDLDLFFTDPTDTALDLSGDRVISLLSETTKFGNQGEGGYSGEDFALYPYQLQNYLQIATGDFTGNGIDDIAVYIPERGKSRIVVYQLQIGTGQTADDLWETADSWTLAWNNPLNEGLFVSNMVSLSAGDITGNGVDDLAFTWGVYYGPEFKTSCQAVVLHGSKAGDFLQHRSVFNLGFAGTELVRAAFALGDVNGNGKNDLVLGAQLVSDVEMGQLDTRFLAMYSYNPLTKAFVVGATGNMNIAEEKADRSLPAYKSAPFHVANMAIVQQDGIGTKEYIYFDSILYEQVGDSFAFKGFFDDAMATRHSSTRAFEQYGEYGVIAGDFNGNGRQTVVTMQSYPTFTKEVDSYPWWWRWFNLPPQYETIEGYIRLLELNTADGNTYEVARVTGRFVNLCFAAPNTDTDSMILEYTGERYLAYSDPKVLAVLASPPYFNDLVHLEGGDDYIGGSATAYGVIEGSGAAGISTHTLKLGAYISFEVEFSFFGFSAAKVETEIEMSRSWTTETERMKEMTQTVEYGTLGGQDTVILYAIPMDIYVYDAYVPTPQADGTIIWEKQTMTINIPYNAVIRAFTLEDYDTIAADYDELPTIGGEILTHTLGDPATYPRSTAGYQDAHLFDGDFVGVGFGSSAYITQSIETSTTVSTTTSISNGVSWKVGGGGGGVMVGVTGGSERGSGTVTTDISGKFFSGTVAGMPAEAAEYGYNYSWKIFQYVHKGSQNFPIVTYLVDDVRQPPKLPTDFAMDVEETTDTSITLTWSQIDPASVGFQIYRHYDFPEGSGDYPIGDIISAADTKFRDPVTGEYTYYFTDVNLHPYTQYKYRIQVIGGSLPNYSALSDVLNTRTKAPEGHPTIELDKETLLVYPDREATVTVTVTNDATNAQPPLYQWQKKIDGSWRNLTGKTSRTLKFVSAGAADAGEYRCRVNQIVGEYAISAFSQTVTVEYSKRTAILDFSINKASAVDMSPTLVAELTNPHTDSGSVPTGTVVFEIKGTDYAVIYTKDVIGGNATLSEWTAPTEGIYEITAYYSGSRVFKSATSSAKRFLAGLDTGYWLEMDDSVTYGDAIELQVVEIVSDEEKSLIGDVEYDLHYMFYEEVVYLVWVWGTPTWRTVWVPVGDGALVEGNHLTTPNRVGDYLLSISVTKDNEPLAHLSKEFTITQRPITIAAPSATMPQTDIITPTVFDLTVSEGSLGFDDTLVSLGLDIRSLDTAGLEADIAPGALAGLYITQVTATDGYPAQTNYRFTFVDGLYTITGTTYSVIGTAEKLLDQTVGSIHVMSPANHEHWTTEYQAATQIVFVASVAEGYSVDRWEVNGIKQHPSNPNVLTYIMPSNAIEVNVRFKVTGNTLHFGGENGSVICISTDLLQSGATVIQNAEYVFKAIPDAGYHFKEWRLAAVGRSVQYPEGDVDDDGYHTYTLTMGDSTTVLTAVFERDRYVLSLGDNLRAYYWWNHDDNLETDEIKKYVASGASITGDVEVTVEPTIGYRIADGSKWYYNGAAIVTNPEGTEYYTGQDFTFPITEDTLISATTELQHYNVDIIERWDGAEPNPGGHIITATIDGQEVALDALGDVAGGSRITVTSTPAYGAVLQKWVVNGEDVDLAQLVNPNVYVYAALDNNLTIEAVFVENEAYVIAVTKGSRGKLSYSLNEGPKITLDTDSVDIAVYMGDAVVFTAEPDENYMVSNWIIDGTVNQTPIRTWSLQNIVSHRTVSVGFVPMSYYTVTFSAEGEGDITALMDGTVVLESGDKPGGGSVITFAAEPELGYMVDTWMVNDSLLTNDHGSPYVHSVYTIEALARDTTVTVSFRLQDTHLVNVTQPEHGQIMGVVTPDDYIFTETGQVRDGATAVFTVIPELGYGIATVSIDGDTIDGFDQVVINDDGTWTCIVNAVAEDLTIFADIVELYTVTFHKNGGNTEANPDEIKVLPGSSVGQLPQPPTRAGYRFKGWNTQQDGRGFVFTESTEVVADIVVYAEWEYIFIPIPPLTLLQITTDVNNLEAGSVQGGGMFLGGSAVNVVAMANEDYEFTHWTANGVEVSRSATYTFVAAGDTALVAHFEQWQEWSEHLQGTKTKTWTVTFSSIVDVDTIDNNIYVTLIGSNIPIDDVQIVVDPHNPRKVLIKALKDGWVAGDYYICINSYVESVSGNKLTQGIRIPFTIE